MHVAALDVMVADRPTYMAVCVDKMETQGSNIYWIFSLGNRVICK